MELSIHGYQVPKGQGLAYQLQAYISSPGRAHPVEIILTGSPTATLEGLVPSLIRKVKPYLLSDGTLSKLSILNKPRRTGPKKTYTAFWRRA